MDELCCNTSSRLLQDAARSVATKHVERVGCNQTYVARGMRAVLQYHVEWMYILLQQALQYLLEFACRVRSGDHEGGMGANQVQMQ